MSEKTAKKALRKAGQRQYQMQKLKEQAAALKQQQQCLRDLQPIPLDGMPKQKGKKDSTGQKAVAVLELEELLCQSILPALESLLAEQYHLEAVLLQTLSQEEYHIIKMRYFEKKSFCTIAKELYCSKSTCYRYHQMVLERLKKVL